MFKIGDKVKIHYCADKEFQDKVGTILQSDKIRGDNGHFTGWSLVMDNEDFNNFYCEVSGIYVNEYVFRGFELAKVTRNTKLARKMYSKKVVTDCGGYLV